MEADKKQYGYYKGGIKDPDIPKTCSERELYLSIRNLNRYMFFLEHEIADGRMEDISLDFVEYAIDYHIMQTCRFGVEIPAPKDGERVELTPSFQAWYDWWYYYFEGMSSEEMQEYQIRKEYGEDLSCYRPKGDWKKLD